MAQKLLKAQKKKVAPVKAATPLSKRIVLVGTYAGDQLKEWPGYYPYPLSANDTIDPESSKRINEIWLFKGTEEPRYFSAECLGVKTRAELKVLGYPAKGKGHGDGTYLLFKIEKTYAPANTSAALAASVESVTVRTKDFAKRSPKVARQLKEYLESADRKDAVLSIRLPAIVAKLPPQVLRVCEAAVQLDFLSLLNVKEEKDTKRVAAKVVDTKATPKSLCKSIAEYSKITVKAFSQRNLFTEATKETAADDIRVIELFAGVGGFRIGLERASDRYRTVWNNQWEPSTKRQDASIVYQMRFGSEGHCNEDIATVPVGDIPQADLLVGGFPCQDYSVATTLKNSGGIEGKKGVLWWQIHRILRDKGENAPRFLILENVDRLLKSPATQRGRDFAIILASLSDLGYCAEWRVINAADYGMPQRRRRTYIVAYKRGTGLANEATLALSCPIEWISRGSVEAQAFDGKVTDCQCKEFDIKGSLAEVTQNFNLSQKDSPFRDAGFMVNRHVCTIDLEPVYNGKRITLGDLVELDDAKVPEEFFVSENDFPDWKYLKGPKSEERTSVDKDGNSFTYHYSEGGMAFPDALDKPSRTIITGEGGTGPSRFKHVIKTPSGRYRRLMPLELERLNMFPDNHTEGASDIRRAFLMGNALVTGIVERIGFVLKDRMQ